MQFALLCAAAYLLGSVPVGVIVGKLRGVDVMAAGSGNTGATNVARVLGWRLGAVVFLLDIAKGAAPVFATKALSIDVELAALAGLCAVVGHTFSPFLRFKGGKGVATGLGALFGASPLVGGLVFGVFLACFALTRIVSLSSLVGSLSVLVLGLFLGEGWVFFAVFGPLIAYVFLRHRGNIVRLLRGEEPKLQLKEGVATAMRKDGIHDR